MSVKVIVLSGYGINSETESNNFFQKKVGKKQFCSAKQKKSDLN
jgi:hypothetical protein